jgi:hypothetical protein
VTKPSIHDDSEVLRNPKLIQCFRHQGKECPRCDGTGYRPREVCAGCGEPAKSLLLGRPARSWKEAKALPMYCFDCNPRFRFADAVMAILDRIDS